MPSLLLQTELPLLKCVCRHLWEWEPIIEMKSIHSSKPKEGKVVRLRAFKDWLVMAIDKNDKSTYAWFKNCAVDVFFSENVDKF